MAKRLLSRDLGVLLHPAWSGWVMRDGVLYSPEGWSVSVHEVRALPLMRLQITTYQTENRKLRQDLDMRIDEQPLPDSWDLPAALLKLG